MGVTNKVRNLREVKNEPKNLVGGLGFFLVTGSQASFA